MLRPRITRPVLIIVFAVIAFLSVALLTLPTSFNPISAASSLLSSYRPQNTVPLNYYDNPEAYDNEASPGTSPPPRQLANATLFMLAQNSEVEGAVQAIREFEDRFNHKYHYPWVFLNEQPFSEEFKNRVSAVASGALHFGQIPREHWYQPEWINETKATEERAKMVGDGIGRAESVPYRNMCRFNSGFFYRHSLMQNFRYYWRVEPGVHFYCDVNFDPFVYMHENNKTYGFTIAILETRRTIETLWSTVKDFMAKYPKYVAPNNAMSFLSDDGGKEFNLCIFFNNFEVADMDFYRSKAYGTFFDHLDRTGGFYYERWGDAPVHSIAASLLADASRVHFFREIGYRHWPFTYCPSGDLWSRGRCACDPKHSYVLQTDCVAPRWERVEAQQSH